MPRGPHPISQYRGLAHRGFEVGSVQKTNEVNATQTCIFRSPIETYGVLEFKAIDQIVEVGDIADTQERLAQMDRATACSAVPWIRVIVRAVAQAQD